MLIHNSTVRHVLHHFGHFEGQDGGDFANALLDAMTKADRHNLGILVRAFPAIGHVFECYKNTPRGPEVLERVLQMQAQGVQVRALDIMDARQPGWVLNDIRTGVTLEDALARERANDMRLFE